MNQDIGLNPTIASTLLRKARPFLLFPHQSKNYSDGLCAEAHEPGFVLNPTIASTLLRKARPFLFSLLFEMNFKRI
ncbi:MAG: hypothetical protein FJZ80_04270 [Bacteroidetes bacterium]|nr:hypothetical protein [Bacteroidota bacterium]